MATTLPADLHTLTEEELVALVAQCSDDETALEALLAELDTRDSDDAAEVREEERKRDLVQQSRRPGETLDQAVDRMYGEHTYQRYLAAETYCRGRMLNRESESAGVDPYSLFHGNARAAAKHASEELIQWWSYNGRQTWIEYKFEMLGRPGDAAAAALAARRTQDYIR